MITFSQTASGRIREIIDEAGEDCAGIRIRAHKLGKYTFRYQLQLVKQEELEEGDVSVEAGTFAAHLDPQTASLMDKASVDFVTADGESGFKIDNPAAEPNWDDPIAAKVQTVIDEKLLPALGQHGGWLELVRVEGETAYIQLGGGCRGCSGAQATLKNGVETAIMEAVPEIKKVADQTDHASGTAPHM